MALEILEEAVFGHLHLQRLERFIYLIVVYLDFQLKNSPLSTGSVQAAMKAASILARFREKLEILVIVHGVCQASNYLELRVQASDSINFSSFFECAPRQ